jgi:hypothetical protein
MIYLHTAARFASPTRTSIFSHNRVVFEMSADQPMQRPGCLQHPCDKTHLSQCVRMPPSKGSTHHCRRVKPAHSARLRRATDKSPEGSRAWQIASRAVVPAHGARTIDQRQHLQFCGINRQPIRHILGNFWIFRSRTNNAQSVVGGVSPLQQGKKASGEDRSRAILRLSRAIDLPQLPAFCRHTSRAATDLTRGPGQLSASHDAAGWLS